MRAVLSYKDYEALPADGRRYELHEGEVSTTPAPSPRHQLTSANLFVALRQHVSSRGLGEVLYAPEPVSLPPFPDLVLVPASIWP